MLTKTPSTSAALGPPGLPLHKPNKTRGKYKLKKQNSGVVAASLLSLPTLAWRWELNYLPELTHAEPGSYVIRFMDGWTARKQNHHLLSSAPSLVFQILLPPKSHVTPKQAGDEKWDSN